MASKEMLPATETAPAVDRGTAWDFLPQIYNELRRQARQNMLGEYGTQTLTATALVHEAWLRLSKDGSVRWDDRRHFFYSAAVAMRRILIERARLRRAQKRGGEMERVELDASQIEAPLADEEILAVNESLTRLGEADPEAAELIHLRYYAGLKWAELAELTGISERELIRQCEYARAWLRADMEAGN